MNERFRIGIVSGKMGDVDGVSLEINKWVRILSELGHSVFTISGTYQDPVETLPPENQLVLEKISFDSAEQRQYEKLLFPYLNNSPAHLNGSTRSEVLGSLTVEGSAVANSLFGYVKEYDIDLIIAQNTNALPMTLLGGMGVYKLITERRVAAILHHHDFWWERSRFSQNHIESLLTKIMPPTDLGIEHVVLSSYAAHILRSLKRVNPVIIPNCEDFDNPVVLDEYNSTFRKDFGFRGDDILIIQPTRIVRRKRLEDSVELLSLFLKRYPNLRRTLHFIVSLYQGDEPDINYVNEIKNLAHRKNVPLHLISNRVSSIRGINSEGQKLYTNRDVLVNADIVTYLPIWEGFGNALLETIGVKVPLVVTTYLVYKTDIKGTGLQNIEIRDSYDAEGKLIISDETLDAMYELLTHPEKRRQMVEKNFEIARNEYSFNTLRKKVRSLLTDYTDEIKASRKRLKKSKILYSV